MSFVRTLLFVEKRGKKVWAILFADILGKKIGSSLLVYKELNVLSRMNSEEVKFL